MVKNIIRKLRLIHGKIYEEKKWYDLRGKYKKIFKDNPHTVFLVFTPEHSNIGDHAIALTETNILKEIGYQYIEITGKRLGELSKEGKLNILDGFPILVNGGGFLGTLWPEGEQLFRNLIGNNPKSTIFLFPNTIYYDNSVEGNKEFNLSKEIYNYHKNLYIYARERHSYAIMKKAYKHVFLAPDIVLYQKQYQSDIPRKGCLLCLRKDIEKTRTEEEEKSILSFCTETFGENYGTTDMIAETNISIEQRKQAVIEKLEEFCGAELVITDRLHAMIFCAITGTPCIVINSKSPKVKGCFEWIKHLSYIKMIDDVVELNNVYLQISKGNNVYDNSIFDSYFEDLKNQLLEVLRKNERKKHV